MRKYKKLYNTTDKIKITEYMFFIGDFFKKIKEKREKIILIKEVIDILEVTVDQKKLYLEAIEVLSDDNLQDFYERLTLYIQKFEEQKNLKKFKEIKQNSFQKQENNEKTLEMNNLQVLLDNV